MRAFRTHNLDRAVFYGYDFTGVMAALSVGDHTEAGRELAAILEKCAADDPGDPEDLGELGALIDRLAVVPIRKLR